MTTTGPDTPNNTDSKICCYIFQSNGALGATIPHPPPPPPSPPLPRQLRNECGAHFKELHHVVPPRLPHLSPLFCGGGS